MTGPPQKVPLYERIAPRVAEMAAEGATRNAIARSLDVSAGTVTRAARHVGAEFDGAALQAAVVANAARSTATRADRAEQAATLADKAGRRLSMELDAEVLDPGAVRSLATVFGIATDKYLTLAATLPSPEESQAKGALDALMGAILNRATPNPYELENQ